MDNFNFNSAICTSTEQSRKLLSLGLKKETADMKYLGTREYYGGVLTEGISSLPMIIDTEDDEVTEYDIPAWSLHRLIEMMPEQVTSDDWLGVSFNDVSYYHGGGEGIIGWKFYKDGNLYDCIVSTYEWLIKDGYFNKEYLEE